jgi:hypothetical protein
MLKPLPFGLALFSIYAIFPSKQISPISQVLDINLAPHISPVIVPPKVERSEDKPLKLTVTVNDPTALKVGEDDTVKQGDILADNFRERSRLIVQKQTISLQIAKLRDQRLLVPLPSRKLPPLKPLPEVDYIQETAAISQAKLRLQQARSLRVTRSHWLNRPNDSAYKQTVVKVDQQNQMLKSMNDLKMQSEVIQHEEAVLKQLQQESNKANLELNQANGQRSQELEQLNINIQLAESELEQKQAALGDAQYRRHLQEYQASVDARTRAQQEEQIALEHARNMALYEQQRRDRNYQLAQLDIQKHQVEDKLADLPIVRSPKSGYIRHIRPWVGKDGSYTTTLTIFSFSPHHPDPDSSSSTNPHQAKIQTGTKIPPSPPTNETDQTNKSNHN